VTACKKLLSELKDRYPENYEQLALLVLLHPEWCENHQGGCDDNCPRKLTNHINKENLNMSELQEYQDRAAAAEAELKKFKVQQKIKDFKNSCEAFVKKGVMTPAERDLIFSNIDEDRCAVRWEAVKEFVENSTYLDFREYGFHGEGSHAKYYDSAAAELADRAQTYSRKHKVRYEKAATAILANDPDLAERYKME
jgi:hypothetical protein